MGGCPEVSDNALLENTAVAEEDLNKDEDQKAAVEDEVVVEESTEEVNTLF